MRTKILISSIVTAFLLLGCDTTSHDVNSQEPAPEVEGITLATEVEESLAYMGNEERLAYDIYNALYIARGEAETVFSLNKIASDAEITHIRAVQTIVQKYDIEGTELSNVVDPVADSDTAVADMPAGEYDIPALQALYDALYAMGKDSDEEALQVACMVEVTDIDDLDKYITQAQTLEAPADVIDMFTMLRADSYKHYWGFDKALINIGITDGCCSLGEIDGVNYCHPEYPTNH